MIAVRDRRPIVLAAAFLVFARVAGGPLPHFLFYFVALLIAASYLWTWSASANLSCTYAPARRHLTACDTLDVKLRLYNEGFLPLTWLTARETLAERLSPAGDASRSLALGPFASHVWSFQLEDLPRGRYRLGPLEVTLGDPFGLFQAKREIYADFDVLVYPRVVRLERLALPARQPFGETGTRERAYEDPASLAEIRPYREGDPEKRVHWKATAHHGELHVREHELTASCDLLLVLDMRRDAHASAGRLRSEDYAVEAAVAIAYYATLHGYNVGLVSASAERTSIPVGKGRRAFARILETLARITARGDRPVADVVDVETRYLPARSTVVVVTPDLSADLVRSLLRLKRRAFGAALVHLPPESFDPAAEGDPRRSEKLRALDRAGVKTFVVRGGQNLREALEG